MASQVHGRGAARLGPTPEKCHHNLDHNYISDFRSTLALASQPALDTCILPELQPTYMTVHVHPVFFNAVPARCSHFTTHAHSRHCPASLPPHCHACRECHASYICIPCNTVLPYYIQYAKYALCGDLAIMAHLDLQCDHPPACSRHGSRPPVARCSG